MRSVGQNYALNCCTYGQTSVQAARAATKHSRSRAGLQHSRSIGSNIVCQAQNVFEVPEDGFARLPEGYRREFECPFTATRLPPGSENSENSEAWHSIQTAKQATFISFHPAFRKLLGNKPELHLMAGKDYPFAHEGAIYMKKTNEVFFVSNLLTDDYGRTMAELWAIDMGNCRLRQIKPCREISTPNGAFMYGDKVALLLQGKKSEGKELPGGVLLVNPDDGICSWLLNNFLGLDFNSPNDIVVTSNGALWFTDPCYASDQDVKGKPQLGNFVWRYLPGHSGVPRVVADQLVRPNGLALSRDESVLYVTDTGSETDVQNPTGPKTIYAYDISGPNQTFVQNRRVFAYADAGIPDGIKVDAHGNVWSGCFDGLNVWNPDGDLIGKVMVSGGVSNFCFAGASESTVVMLNEQKVFSLEVHFNSS